MVANRTFIQAEIVAWIEVQIAGGVGIWSGFTYDRAACRRDVGFIVDAMCYDIHTVVHKQPLLQTAILKMGECNYPGEAPNSSPI